MNSVTLKAELRAATGKGVARKLRAAGKLPAVAYGRGFDAISLSVDAQMVSELIRTGSWAQSLIVLDGVKSLEGKTFMIRELQRHHIKATPLTLDLLAIRMDEKIKVQVPVDVKNPDEIKKQGGLLEILARELEVKCLPTQIPASLEIDAASLRLGQTLHISDLTLPEGVEIDLPGDYPLVTVVIPRGDEPRPGEAAAAAGTPAQPEATAQKKDKEQG